MRKLCLLLIPVLMFNIASASGKISPRIPIQNLPLITGSEVVNAPVALPPYNQSITSGMDVIGDTFKLGTTWWEDQANGTIGRMIAKDNLGYIHFVWMNQTIAGSGGQRNVFYNCWDINSSSLLWQSNGIQVDGAQRAGYACLDQGYNGIAFPSFHEISPPSTVNRTAAACDILQHAGSFLPYDKEDLPPGITNPVIWPRMQMDINGRLHIASTENSASGVIQNMYYIYATYDAGTYSITYPPGPAGWTWVDTSRTICVDVATSPTSARVALTWSHPRLDEGDSATVQTNNDLYYVISEDGLNFDFSNPINITNFVGPDYSLLPDTLTADRDTLRVYTDLCAFFDQRDYLHIAFTTPGYYAIEGTASYLSFIWHWTEEYPDEISLVANGWTEFADNFYSVPGAWNRTVCKPSLGEKTSNGYLYCAYQRYDTDSLTTSLAGYASGEVYITVSTDNGLTWAEGTNVTQTLSPDSAVAGACLSELDPTMNKVVDNYCHLIYVMDKDAGFVVQTEGEYTLNNVYYQRVPVGAIPTTPLIADTIYFHVPPVGVRPEDNAAQTVKVFDLKQNYPNPFNPTTAITFSLDRMGEASLNVYNLKGEIVATVASGNYTAGAHTVTFDGSNLASGIYLYRLKAGDRTLENKMLLLK